MKMVLNNFAGDQTRNPSHVSVERFPHCFMILADTEQF